MLAAGESGATEEPARELSAAAVAEGGKRRTAAAKARKRAVTQPHDRLTKTWFRALRCDHREGQQASTGEKKSRES